MVVLFAYRPLGPVNAEDIVSPTATTGATVRHLVSYLLTEAEARYDSGISGLCFLPAQARLAIYRRINLSRDWHGDRRPRFRRLDRSSYTTKTQKWLIAFKGMVTFLFKKPHQYQGFHDPALHRGPQPPTRGPLGLIIWTLAHIIGGGLSGLSLASRLQNWGTCPDKSLSQSLTWMHWCRKPSQLLVYRG